MTSLAGRHILIMATDRFEESELFGPRERLLAEGAKVSLASLEKRPIQATVHDELGKTIAPDMTLGQVDPAEYDALLLPGGVGNPDRLRMEPEAWPSSANLMRRRSRWRRLAMGHGCSRKPISFAGGP